MLKSLSHLNITSKDILYYHVIIYHPNNYDIMASCKNKYAFLHKVFLLLEHLIIEWNGMTNE